MTSFHLEFRRIFCMQASNMSAPPRRPNFVKDEIKALTDGVNSRKSVLFSSFNNTDTHIAKERAWGHILEEVNAMSSVKRTKDEIRRKWTYLKSEAKKKNSETKKSFNKTGGGPLEKNSMPDETEQVVLSIIGPTALNGITGGVDTTSKALAPVTTVQTVTEKGDSEVEYEEVRTPFKTSSSQIEQRKVIAKPSGQSLKRPLPSRESDDNIIIKIERERLEIEKERLKIEERRMKTEEERLEVEKTRLEMERKRMKMEEDRQQGVPQGNYDLYSPFNSQGQSGSFMNLLQMN